MSGVELQQKIEAAIRESLERTVGNLRDEVSRRLRHSQEEVLDYLTALDVRKAMPTLPAELLTPPAPPTPPPPAPDTSKELLASLGAGLRAIDGGKSQAAILRALLVASSRHTQRAAIFLMTKEGARLWEGHGFARAPLPAVVGATEIPALDALRHGGGAASLDAAACRAVALRLGVEPASEGVLIPLILRDQVAAALYADRHEPKSGAAEPLDATALQLLGYVSALSIETLGFRKRDTTPTLTPLGEPSGAHLEPWGSGAEKPAPAAPAPAPLPTPEKAPTAKFVSSTRVASLAPPPAVEAPAPAPAAPARTVAPVTPVTPVTPVAPAAPAPPPVAASTVASTPEVSSPSGSQWTISETTGEVPKLSDSRADSTVDAGRATGTHSPIAAAPAPPVPASPPPPAAKPEPAFERSLLWADESAVPKKTEDAPPAGTSFTAADWWTRFPEAAPKSEPAAPAAAPAAAKATSSTAVKPLGPLAPAAPAAAAAPASTARGTGISGTSLPSLSAPAAPPTPTPPTQPTTQVTPPSSALDMPSFDESLPSLAGGFGTVRIPRASELFGNVRDAKPPVPPPATPAASAPTAPIAAAPSPSKPAPIWDKEATPPPVGNKFDVSTAQLDVSEDETVLLPGRSPGNPNLPPSLSPTPPSPPTPSVPLSASPATPAFKPAATAPIPAAKTTPLPTPGLPTGDSPVSAATQRIPTTGLGGLGVSAPPASAAAPPPGSGGSTAELPRPRSSAAEVVPPENLRGPGSAFGGLRSGESPASDEARRLARLLVSEIKLYNEEQVDLGRKNLDLYQRLREDIDRSRQMYDERVDPSVKSTDYFQQELVRILAGGDARALGS